MDQKQISADRKKYAAQLADVERQASALRDMLNALDKLEGNRPVQIALPLVSGTKASGAPVKLTAAVMGVFKDNPGVMLGASDVRQALQRNDYDTSHKKFPLKLSRTLQRQMLRGVLRGSKTSQGRWSYSYDLKN